MPTAFLFRKKLVDGCTCKPAPWSVTGLNRHRQYAIAEGRSVPPLPYDLAPAIVVAGRYPDPKPIEQKPVEEIDVAPEPTLAPGPTVAMAPSPVEQPAPGVQLQLGSQPKFAMAEKRTRAESRPRVQQQPGQTALPPRSSRIAGDMPRVRKPAESSGPIWLAASPGKFAWPGDAPTRYR